MNATLKPAKRFFYLRRGQCNRCDEVAPLYLYDLADMRPGEQESFRRHKEFGICKPCWAQIEIMRAI